MNSDLLRNNYKLIKNFIPKNRAIQLYKEFKLCDSFYNFSGDPQSPNSSAVYNYLPSLELLCEKTKEVSTITEETVLPTYTYSRIYREGSVLTKHTDRSSCEISLTVHLYGDKPWPIWIQTPSNTNKCLILEPGDAMIYLGCVAPHWRDEYVGKEYAQFFLHYVRSRGSAASSYFDKGIDREPKLEKLIKEYKEMGWLTEDKIMDGSLDRKDDSSFLTKKSTETYVFPFREKPNTPQIKTDVVKKSIEVDIDDDFVVYGDEDSPFSINKKYSKSTEQNPISNNFSDTPLKDFVKVFDNALDPAICQIILDEYKNSTEWTNTLTGSGHDPNARNCSVIPISFQDIINKNPEIRQQIDQSLFECVSSCIDRYSEETTKTDLEIKEDSGYELLRYFEGQFYVQHTDSFKESPRAITFILSINDDYEGGEISFFNRELTYKLKQGSCIMFPSNFMYPHEIRPIIKGTRYSIITWLV
jgi:Rps23 Pro-64 3,4-dihydroxylase Tpa1-like proline 4-hydroxylase